MARVTPGEPPQWTEAEENLARILGFIPGISYRRNLDDAVTYFENVNEGNPHAFIGLGVVLNTFILQLVKDFDITPKEERIHSNASSEAVPDEVADEDRAEQEERKQKDKG